METTCKELIEAGAMRQLCLFHVRQNGEDATWEKTLEYAKREFRDHSDDILTELVIACEKSYELMRSYMHGVLSPEEYRQRAMELHQWPSGNTVDSSESSV